MKKQYYWGYTAVALSILATYGLYFGSMSYHGTRYHYDLKYLAKIGSMGTVILMCWAFLLSTRLRPIEKLFGGLDKVYRAHRRIGEIAFALIFLHPVFLALDPHIEFIRFFWFSDSVVGNTGLTALILFAFLVIVSVWRILPYHFWKQTHHFFGPLLVLVIAHAVLARGEIMTQRALTIWFGGWTTLALACYLYIRLLYRWLGPLYTYVVEQVNKVGEVNEIHLRPLRPHRRIRHRPGQFLYIDFETEQLNREPHPFSICSPGQETMLRISVKEAGDWTGGLHRLKVGTKAHVWGPYGQFGDHLFEYPEQEAVLIAGGIGITPFYSMIKDSDLRSFDRRRICLIYSVVEEEKALYREELAEAEKELGPQKFHFVLHCTGENDDFLDAEKIQGYVGGLEDRVYLICGPKPMMDSLIQQLSERGVSSEKIFTEDFSIV